MKGSEKPGARPSGRAQRRYFYFTAAVCGAAIMIIEILGAKLLAPYVGTSHFVWTAQIAVTLGALAVGYYCGGRWADRAPEPARLYVGLLAAAVYLCGAVTQVERVAYACLRLRLALGSLLTSAFLFFVPLALLAMVAPFLARLLTLSVDNVGRSVGRLTAISTAGSVVGTLLIGYVLIPLMSNSLTMILTAGAVMALAGAWLLVWGRSRRAKAATVLALLTALGCGWAVEAGGLLVGPKLREIYRGNSNFGLLQVIESRQGHRRYLLNDFLMQAAYDGDSRQSVTLYSYLLGGLARAYAGAVHDALVIGLGGGIVPMELARAGARVDVAEINPAIVPLARRYFDFEPERVHLALTDGRAFLNTCRRQYDAILVDAFLGDAAPSHLLTREAFAAMRARLQPGGVVVLNCWGNFAPGRDFLVASVGKTLRSVFAQVRIHCDTRRQAEAHLLNVFFVASVQPLSFHPPADFEHVHPLCREAVAAAFATQVQTDPQRGIVLTDAFNPVDYYDAANREQERRALALRMQR